MNLLTKIRAHYYGRKWWRLQERGFEWLAKTRLLINETNPTLGGIVADKVTRILVADGPPVSLNECTDRMATAVTTMLDAAEQEQRRLEMRA